MEAKFQLAKDLIYQAGQYIRDEMKNGFEVHEKGRFDDLVTDLDKAVQDMMIKKIAATYPQDHFLAEEDGIVSDISQGHVWVLDPIDGTVNFIVQGSDFAVMIAYYEDGIGQFGLIYDVMADVLYSGGGSFDVKANDRILSAFSDKPLNRCLIGANSGMFLQNYKGLADLGCQTLGIRGIGSAGISISRVLEGHFLAYFSYISPWDYAAGKVLGEKLGYQVLDMDGKEPDFKTRQKVMFVPKAKLNLIQEYIK